MELDAENSPISVTLIKPSAIDTPYVKHAKNYMDEAAQIPPPVYVPETVARTILHCAEHPQRDVFVGAGGASLAMMGHYAPRLTDKVMELVFAGQQKKDEPPRPREQNGLDRAAGSLEERGGYEGPTISSNLYAESSMRPVLTGTAVASAGLVGAAVWRASRASRASRHDRRRR